MSARLLSPTPEGIEKAARELRAGKIVGMPTETVYGLAGDLFQVAALGKIYEAKERPTFDPLIAHVAPPSGESPSLKGLERAKLVDSARLSEQDRKQAEALMRKFWPGPLTLVLPKRSDVPDLATSGLPTVAVRMPAHPVAQALIRAAGSPLAAPSANRFGRISPTTAEAVREELGDRIGSIIDGGSCAVGVESTIVVPGPGGWRLLRPGGVPLEELEAVLGARLVRETRATSPEAPGQLDSHYAPGKPLRLLPKAFSALSDAELGAMVKGQTRVGVLLMAGDASAAKRLEKLGARAEVLALSRSGDLTEVAAALFAMIRKLDRSDATLLLAEPPATDRGLGFAIADRLKRASEKKEKE